MYTDWSVYFDAWCLIFKTLHGQTRICEHYRRMKSQSPRGYDCNWTKLPSEDFNPLLLIRAVKRVNLEPCSYPLHYQVIITSRILVFSYKSQISTLCANLVILIINCKQDDFMDNARKLFSNSRRWKIWKVKEVHLRQAHNVWHCS